MKDRLAKFMKNEGLVSSRLADIMGVPPSNISHLLSGRNKPGFEFLSKMMQRFPKLNPDWLILGTGPMYRGATSVDNDPLNDTVSKAAAVSEIPVVAAGQNKFSEPELFETINKDEYNVPQVDNKQAIMEDSGVKSGSNKQKPAQSSLKPLIREITTTNKTIDRVLIFFNDRTFTEYTPS